MAINQCQRPVHMNTYFKIIATALHCIDINSSNGGGDGIDDDNSGNDKVQYVKRIFLIRSPSLHSITRHQVIAVVVVMVVVVVAIQATRCLCKEHSVINHRLVGSQLCFSRCFAWVVVF